MKITAATDALLAIPLSALVLSPKNVRRQVAGIEALADAIATEGLIQNLVVESEHDAKGAETGRYRVVAGGRRLRALQLLKRQRKLPAGFEVPCRVVPAEAALGVSLAENAHRDAMHPADEFEAFSALVQAGASVEDVAARFGVTPAVVRQRMRLANVAPELLAVFRSGGMGLAHVMALAVSEDHDAQRKAWAEAPRWVADRPELLRQALTCAEVPATDRRAKLVGLKAYTKAGGTLRNDLFADAHGGAVSYLQDVELLDRLALAKLQAAGEKERAARGLAWVEVGLVYSYELERHFQRVRPIRRTPTEAEATEIASLRAEVLRLETALDGLGDDESADVDELSQAWDEARERLEAAEDALDTVPDAVASKVGVLVGLGHDGKPEVRAGFIRASDAALVRAVSAAVASGADAAAVDAAAESAASGRGAALPDTVVRRLSVHRTAALRAALAASPAVALVATVHALLLQTVYRVRSRSVGSALTLSLVDGAVSSTLAPDVSGSVAERELQALLDAATAELPDDPGELFAWLLRCDQAQLLRLQALAVAHSLDAVQTEGRGTHSPRNTCLAASRALADALQLDMRRYWMPTADAFLAHVPKGAILAALSEVGQDQDLQALGKAKKAALIESAEPVLVGAEWLPAPLRGGA